MKRVSKIVASDVTHRKLGKQLADNRALHQRLKQLLPQPLDSQLKAAVVQNGCLSLFLPSPVWASRFRYLIPRLKQQLRQSGMPLDRVITRILPHDPGKPKAGKKRHRPTLSRETGEQLRQCAETISDPSLREALLRISSYGEKNQ